MKKQHQSTTSDDPNFDGKSIGFSVSHLMRKMKEYFAYQVTVGTNHLTTPTHGWVLGYLYRHQEEEIYQKTLEEVLHMAPSSVASLAKNLEKGGYIKRVPVETDARLKKITLTSQGMECHMQAIACFEKVEEKAKENLSREETEQFFRILKKMIHNFDDMSEQIEEVSL